MIFSEVRLPDERKRNMKHSRHGSIRNGVVIVSFILILLLGLAIGARQFMQARVPDGPLPEQIAWVMERAHESEHLIGNVLVVRGDEVLYERSFGMADTAKEIPNGPETKFLIASLTKPFTAVLVMQLVDSGKLTFNATLASIFTNLQGKPAGNITIHQLLTHTSGIEEIISRHPDRRITPDDLETAIVKDEGVFEYSNTGYVCLALVIESLTALPYETVLERDILIPAGMTNSGVVRTGRPIEGLARGHRTEEDRLVPAELGFAIEAVDGAGSMYSTARDLWRFDQALATEKLLSPSMKQLMVTQHVKERFGYGWFLSEQGGQYFPWHTGQIPGHATVLVRQTHRNEVIVILSNIQEANVGHLKTRVLQVLKRQP